MKALLFLVLLLAIPAVSAYHLSSFPDPDGRETVDIRNRLLATNTVNLDDAPAGNIMTYTFPWDPEFSFNDRSHTVRIQISYTASFPSVSDGTWAVSVAKETTGNLSNCAIGVETVNPTGITLDALLVYAHYSWTCLFTQSDMNHPHNHTVYINRTVSAGTPTAMEHEVLGIRLETEDVVLTDTGINEITEALNLYLPLLLFLGMVIWAEIAKVDILYLITILLGGILVPLLWDEVAGAIRLTIILITLFLGLRLWEIIDAKPEGN